MRTKQSGRETDRDEQDQDLAQRVEMLQVKQKPFCAYNKKQLILNEPSHVTLRIKSNETTEVKRNFYTLVESNPST